MSGEVVKTGVRLALQARRATAWGQAVPWEVFLNDVLLYARRRRVLLLERRVLLFELRAVLRALGLERHVGRSGPP